MKNLMLSVVLGSSALAGAKAIYAKSAVEEVAEDKENVLVTVSQDGENVKVSVTVAGVQVSIKDNAGEEVILYVGSEDVKK